LHYMLPRVVDKVKQYTDEYYRQLNHHMEMIFRTGETVVPLGPEDGAPEMRMIFMSDMDFKTYELEKQDYHIWFTCEVDGIEYRLAARKY
jgi:hypothetical protein